MQIFGKSLSIDPRNWRTQLFAVILRLSVFVSALVYPPSVYLVLKTGRPAIAVIDTLAVIAILCIYFFDRLPLRLRATVFCYVGYMLGTALLIEVGSISQIYLFAFSIVTTMLLGVPAGLLSAAISSLTVLAVGYFGYAAPTMAIEGWTHGLLEWVVITINFGLLNAFLTLCIGAVLTGLETALAREVDVGAALERERRVLQTLIDSLPDAVYVKDAAGKFIICNPAALAFHGQGRDSNLTGKTVFDLFPRDLAESLEIDDRQVLAGRQVLNREEPGPGVQLTQAVYLTTKIPLPNATGAIVGLIGVSRDISERRKLEQTLLQSQKMDAVGQLAGGVAHDFNNLVTVISGYSEVLLADMHPEDPNRGSVKQILNASDRAAGLTKQLLAFSRKSVIEPKLLDPNAEIKDLERMLSRMIGENIVVTTVLGPRVGRVKVDPTQLGQVLINLAVNARDAMPRGGHLTIESSVVELDDAYVRTHPEVYPGEYVRISVTDTGSGMAPEVKSRAFEPFFTTKGVGQGTGLGLAVVHGAMKQSGGHVELYSELGIGTTFKLYLPMVEPPATATTPMQASDLHGSGTILLVEDEDGVRAMALRALETYGYTVHSANGGREALRLLDRIAGSIDLLVTDVIMPEMDGRTLAETLKARLPHLKVLYLSGYTDDAVVRHGVLQEKMAFLQKPFTFAGLARKVRQVLDEG